MINMNKNSLRSLYINTARKINSKLLRTFKTSDLVAALESRTDICTTRYVTPDAKFLVDTNWGALPKEGSILGLGPAVILVVID